MSNKQGGLRAGQGEWEAESVSRSASSHIEQKAKIISGEMAISARRGNVRVNLFTASADA
jgi:hypothetical protein